MTAVYPQVHPTGIVPSQVRTISICSAFQYGMPAYAKRGGHAHIEQKQFLIAMSGILNITTQQGDAKWAFKLDSPRFGLYIPSMT